MLRILQRSAALLLCGSVSLFAQTTKIDWDQKYKDLKEYDSFAGNLKNSDGTFKAPKKEILAAFKEPTLNEELYKVAELYKVDPRAIVGAILAENTLNCTRTDTFQDFLVASGVASAGSLLGNKFSFGGGQLYMDATKEAEPLASVIEKRSMRSKEEIAEVLLTPAGSVHYVAAVVRRIQDVYEKNGFDIKNKPEILDTVYNLGGAEWRSAKCKSDKTEPRYNYFGMFVQKNIATIESNIGYADYLS